CIQRQRGRHRFRHCRDSTATSIDPSPAPHIRCGIRATLGFGGVMAQHNPVRPRTAVLTRGFDPTLSVGSARPAVFRTSTFVFESPEAAEHAFAITTGKIKPENGERADLIYSRFSHPNAEILEDQIVPLEAGAHYAAVFNSGMAAIMTAFFAYARAGASIVYT